MFIIDIHWAIFQINAQKCKYFTKFSVYSDNYCVFLQGDLHSVSNCGEETKNGTVSQNY